MKNETQRAAITAIIDEIEQTQRAIGFDVSQPTDREARQTVEHIERRLLSTDMKHPESEGNTWIKLGDAALAALGSLSKEKGA